MSEVLDLEEFTAPAVQLAAELIAEYLAPPPRQSVTEWAEANRRLSSMEGSEPGPYRVARTPYAREPQDCMSPRSVVEEVILMWAAQTSKTTVLLNCVGAAIGTNPGPIMIVWPTNTVAKRNSRQRIAPLLAESPQLAGKVAANRSRDKANTTQLKEFGGGVLMIVGANSAADLRSSPIRDLYLDEVDNFPLDVDGEGDPSKLAEARQTTFARKKRLRSSTPTTKDFSRIETAYLGSDRCRYHVPCPHCGAYQPLEFGSDKPHGLKWDKDEEGAPVPTSVRYVCAIHGCEIREHAKRAMLAAGAWVADDPGAKGGKIRGFHLSGLYSPLGWLSWRQIAQEWFEASRAATRGDLSLLRVFVNTRLAETFEEQGDKADANDLRRRAPEIPLGVVQWGRVVRTMGVDVQGDRVEAFDWAWGRGMRSQLLAAKVFYGDPSLPETEPGSPWGELTKYRETAVPHASGREVPLLACFVDSGGHHTHHVYAYCRAHQREHVHAIKGASMSGKPILGKPTDQDVNWRGQKIKKGVKLWMIGTDTAKAVIYGRLRIADEGPGHVLLSRSMSQQVFDGLTSERLITRYVKGRAKLEWILPPGRRNEALDGAVYATAAAHYRGIDRFSDGEWAKWEARVEAPLEPEKPAIPPPVAEAPPMKAAKVPGPGGKISLAGMTRFKRGAP